MKVIFRVTTVQFRNSNVMDWFRQKIFHSLSLNSLPTLFVIGQPYWAIKTRIFKQFVTNISQLEHTSSLSHYCPSPNKNCLKNLDHFMFTMLWCELSCIWSFRPYTGQFKYHGLVTRVATTAIYLSIRHRATSRLPLWRLLVLALSGVFRTAAACSWLSGERVRW